MVLALVAALVPARGDWDETAGVIIAERWPDPIPLGGLGCGALTLYTDGAFGPIIGRELPAEIAPVRGAFLAVACDGVGWLLRQPVADDYAGPRPVAECRTTVHWPLATLGFSDPALPVRVELRAAGALVPHDLADSALPAAMLQLTVTNPGARARRVLLALARPGRDEAVVCDRPATVSGWHAGAAEPAWWDAFAAGGVPTGEGPDQLVTVPLDLPADGRATVNLVVAWHDLTQRLPARARLPRFEPVTTGTDALTDGDPATTFGDGPARPAEALLLELAQPTAVYEIVVHGADAALDLEVAASLDGVTWRALGRLPAPGFDDSRRTLRPVDLVEARHVKLVAAGGDAPWRLGEIEILGATGMPAGVVGVTARRMVDEPNLGDDVGRPYRDRFATADQVARHVLAERERLLRETAAWQAPILESSLPSWLKRKLPADLAGLLLDGRLTADGRWTSHTGAELDWARAAVAAFDALGALFPSLRADELRRLADDPTAAWLMARAWRQSGHETLRPRVAGVPSLVPTALPAGGRHAAAYLAGLADAEAAARDHLAGHHPVPPVELTSDGRAADLLSPLPELQTWLGAALIRAGRVDDGLDVYARCYRVTWNQAHRPWRQPPHWDVPDGVRPVGDAAVVGQAGWSALAALAGVDLDVPGRRLTVAPRLPTGAVELRIPVYLPRCWLDVEFAPDRGLLRVEVLRVFGEPVVIDSVAGWARTVPLEAPSPLAAGTVLDLSAHLATLVPSPRGLPAVRRRGPTNRPRPGYPTAYWTATAEGDGLYAVMASRPELAFDGDRLTRWSTGRDMRAGDRFVLDLGEPLPVGRLDVSGGSPRDYPRGLRIDLSLDGTTWQPAWEGDLTVDDDGAWQATFTPRSARFVRLTNLRTTEETYWSLHELVVADK